MAKKQSLVFQLGADTREFAHGMKSIKKMAGGAASQLAGVFGVGMGFAGIAATVGAVVSKLDEIGDRAEQLGVGVEFFQKMEFAAKRSGLSMEAVGAAIQKMKERIGSAGQGDAGAIIAFKKMRLNFKELQDMKPEDAFQRIADALSKVENGNLRAALTQDILGRGANNLMPVLMKLPELMEEASKKQIFTKEQIDKASELSDAVAELKNNAQGFIADTGIIQYLANLTTTLRDAISESAKAALLVKKDKIGGTAAMDAKQSFALDLFMRQFGGGLFLGGLKGFQEGFDRPVLKTAAISRAEVRAANDDRQDRLLEAVQKTNEILTEKLPNNDTGGRDDQ